MINPGPYVGDRSDLHCKEGMHECGYHEKGPPRRCTLVCRDIEVFGWSAPDWCPMAFDALFPKGNAW